MNAHYVAVKNLSKSFQVLTGRKTFFRLAASVLRRESLSRRLWALKDVSFHVNQGECLGIIGLNGSGKTTLTRILAGIYEPTGGEVVLKDDPAVMLHAFIGLMEELPVIDNIFLFGRLHDISRRHCEDRLERIWSLSGLKDFAFHPVKKLSWGQRRRLGLSIFFQTPKDLMIFDESLIFLDNAFLERCQEFFDRVVAAHSKTLMLVSHNMSFLRQYTQRVIWLDEGRVVQAGDPAMVIEAYERFAHDRSKGNAPTGKSL